MPSLYILIPVAMIFVALAIRAFFWALDNDQFRDTDKEARRILFDRDEQRAHKRRPPQA